MEALSLLLRKMFTQSSAAQKGPRLLQRARPRSACGSPHGCLHSQPDLFPALHLPPQGAPQASRRTLESGRCTRTPDREPTPASALRTRPPQPFPLTDRKPRPRCRGPRVRSPGVEAPGLLAPGAPPALRALDLPGVRPRPGAARRAHACFPGQCHLTQTHNLRAHGLPLSDVLLRPTPRPTWGHLVPAPPFLNE